jgi:hypothetical protein
MAIQNLKPEQKILFRGGEVQLGALADLALSWRRASDLVALGVVFDGVDAAAGLARL